jgi:hypothetical protein
MNMRRLSRLLSSSLLLTTVVAGIGTASAAPLPPLPYGLSAIIPIPATAQNNQGGQLTGFDISFVDPVTGFYYFADRSNASVDIINGATFKVVGQAGGTLPGGGQVFSGQLASNSISGPDGVVVVNNGTTATLYAGNGNSTLRSFNVTNPATPILGGSVSTNGQFRLDEMAYSPLGQTILAANNAETNPYASLISVTSPLAPALVTSPIAVPNQIAGGGLEQPVWDPQTGTWFVSVPNLTSLSDAGGVQEYSLTGTPLRQFNFTSMGVGACAPSGLGLGANGNLMVGCSNAGPVVLNPAGNGGNGSIVTQLAQSHGADELWYNPTNNTFAVTGANAAGHRVIDVFDGSTYALLQEIDLTALGFGTANMHSVAVDPLNGEIFVPIVGSLLNATNTACPNGCVAAFDLIPEPSSLVLLGSSLLVLAGVTRRRRRKFTAERLT